METSIVKSDDYQIVKFENADIVCPIINGTPFIVIKCITEVLGMHQKTATGDLKNHPRLGSRVAEWQPVSQMENLSNQHVYVCLPINKISAWLYQINVNKVAEKVKPILLAYQEKCDDVLFDAFFGGHKNIIAHHQKALPLKSEIEKKIEELRKARLDLDSTDANKEVERLKRELANLRDQKRRLDRQITEPTLF
jgi:hypothetical protein